jgi:hypothetical protein
VASFVDRRGSGGGGGGGVVRRMPVVVQDERDREAARKQTWGEYLATK